jgi:uncharacterized protein (DUF2164 family)
MAGIELEKRVRGDAVASVQRYFEENMPEPLGELAAGMLLDFFLEEIGPVVYNQAIADAQARISLRVGDLSGELFAEPMQYWARVDAKRKRRKP